MKRLVLSEGRRDVRFVKLFYQESGSDVEIDTFYGEDVESSSLKNPESEKIRNFLEPWSPYDVLAKSENGRDTLERVFTKLIHFLAGRDLAVTVLVDLDNNSLDELVRNLDTRIEDNYENKTLGVRTTDRPVRSRAQVGVVADLYSKTDDTRLDTFEILAFRDCLEAAAGIDGSEDESTEDSKLRAFVGDERATAPMRELLL